MLLVGLLVLGGASAPPDVKSEVVATISLEPGQSVSKTFQVESVGFDYDALALRISSRSPAKELEHIFDSIELRWSIRLGDEIVAEGFEQGGGDLKCAEGQSVVLGLHTNVPIQSKRDYVIDARIERCAADLRGRRAALAVEDRWDFGGALVRGYAALIAKVLAVLGVIVALGAGLSAFAERR